MRGTGAVDMCSVTVSSLVIAGVALHRGHPLAWYGMVTTYGLLWYGYVQIGTATTVGTVTNSINGNSLAILQ